MKKRYIIFLLIISIILLSNLGRFLDVSTSKVSKSDIVVSLGGDNGTRIKKTLELYNDNYSTSKKIIITGVDNFDKNMRIHELDWRSLYLQKKGLDKKNIIINNEAVNTLEEIFFIKKYMIMNNYKNLIIISDAPHSRRIDFFANGIANFKKDNIILTIVSSDNSWWNKNTYYKNPEAIIFSINEVIKLAYYYINYKLGTYDEY